MMVASNDNSNVNNSGGQAECSDASLAASQQALVDSLPQLNEDTCQSTEDLGGSPRVSPNTDILAMAAKLCHVPMDVQSEDSSEQNMNNNCNETEEGGPTECTTEGQGGTEAGVGGPVGVALSMDDIIPAEAAPPVSSTRAASSLFSAPEIALPKPDLIQQSFIKAVQSGSCGGSASSCSSISSPLPSPSPSEDSKKGRGKRPGSKASSRGSGGKKKKKAESPAAPGTGSTLPRSPYECLWQDCRVLLNGAAQLVSHVTTHHFKALGPAAICLWRGCDGLVRRKWSMITHVQERHLTESALQASFTQRLQHATKPQGSELPPPPAVSVYPADAAMQAIKRFSNRASLTTSLQEPREGPVTKHLRLTSALILRNLARYSPLGRHLIKQGEDQLANVALSQSESSSAVASCLLELCTPLSVDSPC